MATPSEKLATSLGVLSELQADGRRIFKSDELTRLHRERLRLNGFLQPVIKGWVMSVSPDARPGDSTAWYASFWEFCARVAWLAPPIRLADLRDAETSSQTRC